MAVKIEKGKKPPPPLIGTRYPWREMDVGDSFAIPEEIPTESMHTMAHRAGERTGRKFSVSGAERRVWRTK